MGKVLFSSWMVRDGAGERALRKASIGIRKEGFVMYDDRDFMLSDGMIKWRNTVIQRINSPIWLFPAEGITYDHYIRLDCPGATYIMVTNDGELEKSFMDELSSIGVDITRDELEEGA